MNLCVILLTVDLDKETKPPKILPKVCYKVGDKTMLEICIENVLRLSPNKIILMVSKHTIFYINKVLKHSDYSKLISFCIVDNELIEDKRKISLAQKCYNGKNVLVVPANAPLLTSKSMYKLIRSNRNIKVNNNIFYLTKENLEQMDFINDLPEENLLTKKEMLQVRTQSELEYTQRIFENN